MPIDSSSRNIFNKSNCSYLPVSTREKPLYVSRNQFSEFNNFSKSNTELIEKNKNLQNNCFSSDRKNTKNKERKKYLNINQNNTKNKNKNKNINEKFL